MTFEWIPERGINQDALARMKQHFHKPKEPPGEAWFMGFTRHMLMFFVEQTPDEWDLQILENHLSDMGFGIRSFGRLDEWVVWYQFALPYLLPKSQTAGLLPLLLSYFMNLYTKGRIKPSSTLDEETQRPLAFVDYEGGIFEEYPGFRDDVLNTLGQAVMEASLWEQGDLSKNQWWYDEWEGYWTCPLYASMFFCLMYLTPDEIVTWVASIAAIKGELWKKEIAEWVFNFEAFVQYVSHPEDIPQNRQYLFSKDEEPTLLSYLDVAGIYWSYAYDVFKGGYASRDLNDYIPAVNIEAFWREVIKYPVLQAE